MDNFFQNDSIINITNGVIEDISFENSTEFVTISYTDCMNCRRRTNETVKLVVSNSTIILDANGNSVPINRLRVGMTVDASFSSAMTRSIPPQAAAFMIRIVGRPRPDNDNITIGRIVDIDRQKWTIDELFQTGSRLTSTDTSCLLYDRKYSSTDYGI